MDGKGKGMFCQTRNGVQRVQRSSGAQSVQKGKGEDCAFDRGNGKEVENQRLG